MRKRCAGSPRCKAPREWLQYKIRRSSHRPPTEACNVVCGRMSRNPVLHADRSRFVLFPIRYHQVSYVGRTPCWCSPAALQLWDAYKKAQESIWTAAEVDLVRDRVQWQSALSQDERDFFAVILAFFAASDGIVVENLAQRFCAEVQIPEARCFYGVQIMM